MDDDAATSPQNSYCPDMAYDLDCPLDELREIVSLPDQDAKHRLSDWMSRRGCTDDGTKKAAEMFRILLIQVMEARNPKKEAWVWAMAAGMECTLGVGEWRVAKRFGVTSAAISKAVIDCRDRFSLCSHVRRGSDGYRSVCQRSALKRAGSSSAGTEYLNRRQARLWSIETVLARFLGWVKANKVHEGLSSWSTLRLDAVRTALRPMAVLYAEIDRELDGRSM